ncbi:retinol dehydrogenase 16-like [Bombina bombina]|uniref:retinol dehydrogenase 16-like n=1 Tax=Bombina bombina TaxID=8345 RepID=UPI00235A7041|nr:retinol dehydrogenase 16-like [Bombina bombina]
MTQRICQDEVKEARHNINEQYYDAGETSIRYASTVRQIPNEDRWYCKAESILLYKLSPANDQVSETRGAAMLEQTAADCGEHSLESILNRQMHRYSSRQRLNVAMSSSTAWKYKKCYIQSKTVTDNQVGPSWVLHQCDPKLLQEEPPEEDFLEKFKEFWMGNPALIGTVTSVVFLIVCWTIKDNLKIKDIQEKHILITGCDSGFGNLLAQRLYRKGFGVIAACLTEKGSEELKACTSPSLKTVLLNVTNPKSIESAVEFVATETGRKGLYGLVNNAGRSTPIGPTDWLDMEDFHRVLDVNLIGLIEVTLKFLPLIKKAQGRIVNVASVMGRLAFGGGGYCLSKCGVESFSDSLRRDMQHFGVKVSIIEPGFFKTGVTSLEIIEKDLHRLWDRLTPEVKCSYGDKYFTNYLKVQRLSMNTFCDADISKVTNCMEHALTARYPKTRYGAGWDAKLFWLPLSYAPAVIADVMLKLLLPRPIGTKKSLSKNQVDV